MNGSGAQSIELEDYRRFYAEEIRVVAALGSAGLAEAFARVPRERFLGPPPWRFRSQAPSRDNAYWTTSEVRDLYHDVFVALKSEKSLNNGQPTVIAGCIDKLQLRRGKRVLHIGCGTGYYTRIMAEVVGPEGAVIGVETDPDLAALATRNLADCPHVTVHRCDAKDFAPQPVDAIWVNTGVTHPHPLWLACLKEGGVMALPLSIGHALSSPRALVIVINRKGDRFAADTHSIFNIYSGDSLRDPGRLAMLHRSVESRSIVRLQSVRDEAHEEGEICIVHAEGFCLSAAPVDSHEAVTAPQ